MKYKCPSCNEDMIESDTACATCGRKGSPAPSCSAVFSMNDQLCEEIALMIRKAGGADSHQCARSILIRIDEQNDLRQPPLPADDSTDTKSVAR